MARRGEERIAMDTEILNEAYERFRGTGPEWSGDQLTNHGPMAVEVLVRRGHEGQVGRWVDGYIRRLEDLPSVTGEITERSWPEALGEGRRVGDWTEFFARQTLERPWGDVLALWWPRLLPYIAAGTTHGVIRTSHTVRALLAGDDHPAARSELAHGLAFWAARAQPVPGGRTTPAGSLEAAPALATVPRIPHQQGTVADRFGQLTGLADWPTSLAALRAPASPEDARARLTGLVDAATAGYLAHGHASPVLLAHTATAPNAVLHCLPALPPGLWAPSLSAVWAASAAIVAAYAPAQPAPRTTLPTGPAGPAAAETVLDGAISHGDEHVIKFTDTAAEVYQRTGNPDALAAALQCARLIDRPG